MAEKITLIDVNIDTSAAVDSLEELTKAGAEMAKQQDEIKTQLKDVNKQILENAKSYQAGVKSEDEFNKSSEELYKKQSSVKTELGNVNKQIAENNNAIKANATIVNSASGSIEQMRAKLANTTRDWKKLSAEERDNTEAGKKLSAQKLQLTNDLKSLESATGDTTRNVGNYTDSILQAMHSTQGAGGAIGGMVGGMASGITSIKAFNMAIAANPILLITSGVMLLVQWLDNLVNRSSSASNEISQALDMVGTVFARLLDNSITVIKGIATALNWLAENTFKVANWMGLMSDETYNAAKSAKALRAEERALFNDRSKAQIQLEKYNQIIAEGKVIVADQTKSVKEREEAGRRVLQALKEQEQLAVSLAQREYDLIKARNELSKSTDNDIDAENSAYAALLATKSNYVNQSTEMVGQISGFEKAELDKRTAQAKEADEQRFKDWEEHLKRSAQAQIDINKVMSDIRAAQTEEELESMDEMLKGAQTNAENMAIIRELDVQNEFALERMRLDEKMNMEIAAAEESGANIELIKRKYAKLNGKIDKDEANAKLSIAGDLAGQLSSLLGESTVAGKVAAIAQATINTYLGATKAIAQGGIWGIAQAAIVIAAGFAQVAKISSTKTDVPEVKVSGGKYERGGKMALFGGRRHSQGGTQLVGSDGSRLEVEAGESAFVLNRSATSAISALSALNQSHGGVAFGASSGLTRFAERGGQLSMSNIPYMTDEIINKLAIAISHANESLPNPVVSVVDINLSQENERRIVNISQL